MTAQHSTGVMKNSARLTMARAIVCVGLGAGALSLVQTVGHISDPAYLIPGLEDGSGHVHYHLARETMVTLGSFAVILLGLFAARGSRTSALWWAMCISSLAYVAAMWSGVVVAGEAAPGTAALIVHTVSSLGLIVGVLLVRPVYGTEATARVS